jgi:hypothetical protein
MSFWKVVYQGLMDDKWMTLLMAVKYVFALLMIAQMYSLSTGLESEGCRWAVHEIENTSKVLGDVVR